MKESHVDVLIIGAGPAGMMAGQALARAGVNVRIIDQKPQRLYAGQADGIQPRTIEVFQSYGMAERLLREGNQMHMAAFYNPRPDGAGVELTERVPDITAPTARYPFEVTLHQGAIEAIMSDPMEEAGVRVERPIVPTSLELSQNSGHIQDPEAYAVKVTLKRLDTQNEDDSTEVVWAKFVIGADGAHSWVRKAIGIELEGSQTDSAWGVVDLVLDTDFPDTRAKAVVNSIHGTMLNIPRENDKNRLYIQLEGRYQLEKLADGRIDVKCAKGVVDQEKIFAIAQDIIKPFRLAKKSEFEWSTIYTVGQRVASAYSAHERVFIVGDACHTHSPKAGQGMNASMADSHNLVWKLVHVLRGWAEPSLLATYELERRKYAQDLIAFDRVWAKLITGKPLTPENLDGVSQEQLKSVFQTFGVFSSGIGVQYLPSAITEVRCQGLATNLAIGQRLAPQIFMRAADRRPVNIQDVFPADTRFGIIVFAGSLRTTGLTSFSTRLEAMLSKYKVASRGSIQGLFNVVTIANGELSNYIQDVPPFLRSHWSKVLLDCVDTTGTQGGNGYASYGVSVAAGAVVVVRPDGHVSTVAPAGSHGVQHLESYFDAFLVPRQLEARLNSEIVQAVRVRL